MSFIRDPAQDERQQPGHIDGGEPFRPCDREGNPGEDPCGRPGPRITETAPRETA